MPIDPNRIACKDGVNFFVKQRATGAIVLSALHEDAVSVSCGLSRYRAPHRPGDLYDEHHGMPVEAVRAYAMGHGGVREGGPVAIALLKKLPSRNTGAPEVAPSASFPSAGGSRVAGRTAAAPVSRAPDQRLGGGSGEMVDVLTPAVIDARKALAEYDGPHLYQGREPVTEAEAHVVWSARALGSLRVRSRLDVADAHRFASHPLREEALALRERLQEHLMAAIPHLTTSPTERRAG